MGRGSHVTGTLLVRGLLPGVHFPLMISELLQVVAPTPSAPMIVRPRPESISSPLETLASPLASMRVTKSFLSAR